MAVVCSRIRRKPTVGTIVPLIKAWRGRSTISDSFTTTVAELEGIQRKLTTGTGKPLIKVMNLLNVPLVSERALQKRLESDRDCNAFGIRLGAKGR